MASIVLCPPSIGNPVTCPHLTCSDLTCPNYTCPNLTCTKLICPYMSCPEFTCPYLTCPVLNFAGLNCPRHLPDTFQPPSKHRLDTSNARSRYQTPSDTVRTPSRHLMTHSRLFPDTFLKPSRNPQDNFQTHSRPVPETTPTHPSFINKRLRVECTQ